MKRELTLVLEGSTKASETLEELKTEGFNATVISTESLRHAVDYYPGDHHFFNLRQFENRANMESVLCLFVIDEERLDTLKDVIRRYTNGFRDIKGFMYSRPIDDFEGSV
ncbi:MAG: hypothetical protein K6E59_03535 [Bacilli bacterium]|nr:hypothetical protein [Bacilli bacterium]